MRNGFLNLFHELFLSIIFQAKSLTPYYIRARVGFNSLFLNGL